MKHVFARRLRREQTDAERKLWQALRGRRFHGFKFRRQQPIGPYVADVVCFESKLIIELDDATEFMNDLASRLTNRVQITSDALKSYIDAVEEAFGADVDYGQAVKLYEAEPIGPGRYSPPKVVRAERHVVEGKPDQKHISTSLVERQNLTMRMGMRRFTRLTNAFSKKVENHRAAVGLHFAHYNFVRQHKTLRITPAMAAGVSDRLWTLEELVEQTSR